MLKIAVVGCLVLWSGLAEAVKWDFDDGTTQGWSAKRAFEWGGPNEFYLFPGEVEDGVWRIDVASSMVDKRDPSPDVTLISYPIGYDSHLFDRVRVRFRTVHDRPTIGRVRLAWTNELNLATPGLDPEPPESRFAVPSIDFVYTTEWQEVEFALSGEDEIVWAGLLRDIRLHFSLDRNEAEESRSVDELIGHFEIDWIELTGPEERSQGELVRPHVEYFHFDDPGLFAPPVFYPITPGLGYGSNGVLTDLDGDGDLDLFSAHYTRYEGVPVWDWVMALNDGSGAFEIARIGYPAGRGPLLILASDVDGDGQDEIIMRQIDVIEAWSIGANLQEEVLSISPDDLEALWEDLYYRRNDFDGDGRQEVLVGLQHNSYEGSMGLVVQKRAEDGGLSEEVLKVLYDEHLFLRSLVEVRDLNADGVDDWVFVGGNRASGFGVFVEWGGGLSPTQEKETHRLTGDGTWVLPGDVDDDGDLDLVVLDPALGGVHVLKNSGGGQPTAVMTSAVAVPAQYRLGDSYPNPFNPAVVIPLDLAADAAGVSLTVYDVLGRRVRQLWQGALPAGTHRFMWDGRDEVAKDVAAGVYLYRVEVDGRVEAKKMMKLP